MHIILNLEIPDYVKPGLTTKDRIDYLGMVAVLLVVAVSAGLVLAQMFFGIVPYQFAAAAYSYAVLHLSWRLFQLVSLAHVMFFSGMLSGKNLYIETTAWNILQGRMWLVILAMWLLPLYI